MTYADPQERRDLIAGLRALADLLAEKPEVSAPSSAAVLIFPPEDMGENGRAEIDRVAPLIGAPIEDRTAEHGHYTASRRFGPVEYRAVFIPAHIRAYHDARASYSRNVIPETAGEA